MDDKKKKKFSFLRSLGMDNREPTIEEKQQNKFYVGNAADVIIARKKANKKMLEEM